MTVLLVIALAAFATSPLWWVWWLRRHPRPLRKPGSAWVGLAGAMVVCWLGVLGLYLLQTDPATVGHPRATNITLAVIAIALVVGVIGSTLNWRAEHTARKRDAALGLATGRRWWPDWIAALGTIFGGPLLAVIAGGVVVAVVESSSPTTLTTDEVNSYMFPALIIAGILMTAGIIYYFGIRDPLRKREAKRLSASNRDYLATEDTRDDHH